MACLTRASKAHFCHLTPSSFFLFFGLINFIDCRKKKDLERRYCILDNQIRNFVNVCEHEPARIPLAMGLVVQRLSGGPQVAPVCLLGPKFQYTFISSMENVIFTKNHSKTLGRRLRV